MNRVVIIAGVVLAALVAVVIVAKTRAPDTTGVAPLFEPRLALAPGTWVEHAVTIDETSHTVPFGGMGAAQPMKGQTALSLTLRLEAPPAAEPAAEGALRLRARFTEVNALSLQIDGKEALSPSVKDALLSTVAEVDLLPTGAITALRLPRSDDPSVRRLFAYVLGELRVSLDQGTQWTAEERLPRGAFTAHWHVAEAREDATVLVRDQRAWLTTNASVDKAKSSVEANTQVELLRRGVIKSLTAREHSTQRGSDGVLIEERQLEVQQTLLAEGELDEEAPENSELAPLEAALLEDVAKSEGAGRDALTRRAEGLTRAGIKQTLEPAIVMGAIADPQRFLWRSAAVMRLDDGVVEDIVELFERDDARTRGRALLTDVLVAGGTEAAQQALTRLLDLPIVENDGESVRLRQRLALLSAPTPATIAFLDAHAGEGSWRDPARIALGSAVRRRTEHHDPAGANAAFAALEREAQGLSDQTELERMVMAYGNTHDPRSLPFLTTHAASPQAQVRHVVAGALRSIDTEQARDTLVRLGQDPDPGVARRAWESLQTQPPRVSVLATASQGVRTKTIPEGAWNTVVTLCAKNLQDPDLRPEALATLQAVVDNAADSRLIARARTLLRRHTP